MATKGMWYPRQLHKENRINSWSYCLWYFRQ